MLTRKQATPNQAREFKHLFGASLSDYWCGFTGFDSIGFDERLIQPADGVSTAQAIEKQYGRRAVALCRELMS